MSDADLAALKKLCQSVPDCGIIVEVGSLMGKSSVCFAENVDPSVTIYCIDFFDESRTFNHSFSEADCEKYNFPKNITYNILEEFQKNTQDYSNIKMIRGNSPHKIEYPGDPIDLFFLDASHKNPNDLENLEYFIRYMKNGGIIAGHDYEPKYPDVMENVHALENYLDTKATFFEGSTIWAIQYED